MTQALYRKWRPRRWEAVIGQEHVVQTLRNAIASQRLAHAMLFAGPRGTGKTTTARLVAKALNCLHPDPAEHPCDECEHCLAVNQGRFLDLIEIDAASNTSVEDVRDLRDKINFSPNQGRYKIYIIDEVHMLSTAAFNALLKTLEEPPPHAVFILATTEVHKIPATVLSRCQRHEFRRIPVTEIVEHLRTLALAENLHVEDAVLVLIARQSTGCMRDAISLLDQLASTGKQIDLGMAQAVLGTAANLAVYQLVDDLLAGSASAGLEHLNSALDSGSDPRQFARQVVDYLREVLLVRMGNASLVDATQEMRVQMARHANGLDPARLIAMIRAFNQAAGESKDNRAGWQPSLPLELAFLQALEGESLPAAESAAQPKVVAAAVAPNAPARVVPAGNAAPSSEPELAKNELFHQIKAAWKQILEQLRKHSPQAQGLFNSCDLLGVQQGILVLGFSTEFVLRKVQEQDLALVRKLIAQTVGQEIPVRAVVSGGRRKLPPEIDQDGMVAAAVNDLGGEIVDIQ